MGPLNWFTVRISNGALQHVKKWFSSKSGVSDLLTWDHHGTLCMWIHTLVRTLAWLFEIYVGCSGYGEVCIEIMSGEQGIDQSL